MFVLALFQQPFTILIIILIIILMTFDNFLSMDASPLKATSNTGELLPSSCNSGSGHSRLMSDCLWCAPPLS